MGHIKGVGWYWKEHLTISGKCLFDRVFDKVVVKSIS